jgi:hypothetical protein
VVRQAYLSGWGSLAPSDQASMAYGMLRRAEREMADWGTLRHRRPEMLFIPVTRTGSSMLMLGSMEGMARHQDLFCSGRASHAGVVNNALGPKVCRKRRSMVAYAG